MMHPHRAHKLAVILFSITCLGIATGLILFQLRANINYFYTPAEALNSTLVGKNIKLGGYVQEGSVRHRMDGIVEFILTDGTADIRVTYPGILPTLFAEGEASVVHGKLNRDNELAAKKVLAKHDENYRPPELETLKKKKTVGKSSVYYE